MKLKSSSMARARAGQRNSLRFRARLPACTTPFAKSLKAYHAVAQMSSAQPKGVETCGLPLLKDKALPEMPSISNLRSYVAGGWSTLIF
jgi:hypothetical protein